jgi:hypothetical protein
MNAGEPPPPPSQEPAGDDEPIELLRAQTYEPSGDFLNRIRRTIHRRSATSQLAAFTWHLPGTILIEIAGLLRHFVSTASGGGKDKEK